MKFGCSRNQGLAFLVFLTFLSSTVFPFQSSGIREAYAKKVEEPAEESFNTIPVITLAEPDKANHVLEHNNLETRLEANCPLGFALGRIFLEFAKRSVSEEDILKFAKEAKMNPSPFGTLLNLANEGQVNAIVLLADASAQDPEALQRELSAQGFASMVLKDSKFDEDSLYLLGFVAVIYRIPPVKMEKILKPAGIPWEAFGSQLGIAQRFLQSAYMISLPKSMGFRHADAFETPGQSGTEAGFAPKRPAAAAEEEGVSPAESEPPEFGSEAQAVNSQELLEDAEPAPGSVEEDSGATQERSGDALDQAKKDLEKVNARLLALDHNDAAALENTIEYLDRKTRKISANLESSAGGESSQEIELARQRILEMLTGLENKKVELAEELGRVKAEKGIQEIVSGQTPPAEISLEDLVDTKESLLSRVKGVNRKDPDAVDEILRALQDEIRRFEQLLSGANVKTESTLRAILAELTAEMRRLMGVKNALLSEKTEEQAPKAAPVSLRETPPAKAPAPQTEPQKPFGFSIPFLFSQQGKDKKTPEGEEPRQLEKKKEAVKIANRVFEETRKKSSRLFEEIGKLPDGDSEKMKDLAVEMENAVQGFRQAIKEIPPRAEAGDEAEAKRKEISELIATVEAKSFELKKGAESFIRSRDGEYSAAEQTVQQSNLVFEGVMSSLEKAPEEPAVLDAKIEEVTALGREFLKKAETIRNSTGDARIDGFRKRLQSLARELEERGQDLRELRDRIAAEPPAEKNAALEKLPPEEITNKTLTEAVPEIPRTKAAAEKDSSPETLFQLIRSRFMPKQQPLPEVSAPKGIETAKAVSQPSRIVEAAVKKIPAPAKVPVPPSEPSVSKPVKKPAKKESPRQAASGALAIRPSEEEETAKALYEKISAELERLEAILPNIRMKSSEELDGVLKEIQGNKEAFLAEYNRLSNSSGAASITRIEESLTDMLEEMNSFEVQVSERLRVIQLREKRSRDQDGALLDELAAEGKKLLEETDRELRKSDARSVELFLAQLRSSSGDVKNRCESIRTPDLKEKAEELLKRLGAASEKLEERQQALIKQEEVLQARAFAGETKEMENTLRQKLSSLRRTDVEAMEAMIGEAEQTAAGIRSRAEAIADSFNSDETGSIKRSAVLSAEGLEKEAKQLGAEIEKLRLLEEEEWGKAQGILQAGKAKVQALWTELDSVRDDEEGLALKQARWEEFKAGLESGANAITNTTSSGRMDAAQKEILALVEQTDNVIANLREKRNRSIRTREEEAARTVYEAMEEESSGLSQKLSQIASGSSKEIEALKSRTSARLTEFERSFRSLQNTTEASGIAFLQSKIRKLLENLAESEKEMERLLEDAIAREDSWRKEEEAARMLKAEMESEILRCESLPEDLAQEASPGISAAREDARRAGEKFQKAFEELSDTSGSPEVRTLKNEMTQMLSRFGALEAELDRLMRLAEARENQRKEEEDSARDLRDRIRSKGIEVEEGLSSFDRKSSREAEAEISELRSSIQAFESDFGMLQDTTGSPEISRLVEECQDSLSMLADQESRMESLLSDLVALEARREREESLLREFSGRVETQVRGFDAEMNALGDKGPAAIEGFIRRLGAESDALETEYQKIGNSTASSELDAEISKTAALLGRLKETERAAGILFQKAVERENILEQEEALAKDFQRKAYRELEETERAAGLLGDKSAAEIRKFLEGLTGRLEGLKREAGELPNTTGALSVEEITAEVNGMLEELTGARAEMAEKLRLMELRETRRAEEERAAGILRENVEKRIQELERQSARTADRGAIAIRDELEQLKQEIAGFEEELAGLKDTVKSEKIEEMKTEIRAFLDGMIDLCIQTEEVLKEVIAFERRRGEEERLVRVLENQVSQALEDAKVLLRQGNPEAGELEKNLQTLGEKISGFEEAFAALKNTAGSEEVARRGAEIARRLEDFRGLGNEMQAALDKAQEAEARREAEEGAARGMRDRFAKALEIVDQEIQGLDERSSGEMEIFLEGLREKIDGYENEYRSLKNTAGSGETTRAAEEAGRMLEDLKRVENDGSEVLNAARELEEGRLAEEAAARGCMEKMSRAAGDLRTVLSGRGEKNLVTFESALVELETGIPEFERELRALTNTTGSSDIVRLIQECAAFEEELKAGLIELSDAVGVLRESEARLAEEENAARNLCERLGERAAAAEKILAATEGKTEEEFIVLQNDLEKEIMDFEQERLGLRDTAGSPEVKRFQAESDRQIEALKRLWEEIAREAERRQEFDRTRQEEIRAAEELCQAVTEDSAALREATAGIGERSSRDIETFLEDLKGRTAEWEQASRNLANTTGTREVFRRTAELEKMLEEFKAVEREAEAALSLVKESEVRRDSEEAAARTLKDDAAQILAAANQELTVLGQKRPEEIERFLQDLGAKIAERDGAFQGLVNTTGSAEIGRLAEAVTQMLEELRNVEKEARGILNEAKELEDRRNTEVQAARNLKQRIGQSLEELNKEISVLEGKTLSELEDFLAGLRDGGGVYEAELRSLENSSNSPEVTRIGEEIRSLLADFSGLEKKAETASIAVREKDKIREEEMKAVVSLRDRISDSLKMVHQETEAGLLEKGLRELETYHANLRDRIEKYESEYEALQNSTGSAPIAKNAEETSGLLDEFAAIEKEVADVLDSMRENETRRKEEENAAGLLKDDLAGFVSDVRSELATLAEKDPREIQDILRGLKKQEAVCESAYRGLKNTTGSEIVLNFGSAAANSIRELKEMVSGAEEVLAKALEREARREDEEKAARELKADIEAAFAPEQDKSAALDIEDETQVGEFVSALDEKTRLFREEFRGLKNTSDSDEVRRVIQEIEVLLGGFEGLGKKAGQALQEAKTRQARREAEERSAGILRADMARALAAAKQEAAGLSEKSEQELEAYLGKLREENGGFRNAYDALKNETESESVLLMIREMTGFLGDLVAAESDAERFLGMKKEAGRLRQEEEKSASDLAERAKNILAEVRSGGNAIALKDSETIEAFLEEVRKKTASLEEELTGLKNSSDSSSVMRLSGEIKSALEELRDAGAGIESSLEKAREFEIKRAEEENAARELRGRLERTAARVNSELPGFEGKTSEEIGLYLGEFKDQIGTFEGEFGWLANTSGSDEAARLMEEDKRLIEEFRRVAQEVETLFSDAKDRETEAIRKKEAAETVALKEESFQALTLFREELKNLSGKGEEEIRIFRERLETKAAELAQSFGGLKNVSDSGEVTGPGEEIRNNIAGLQELGIQAGEILEEKKRAGLLRREEEARAKERVARMSEMLEKFRKGALEARSADVYALSEFLAAVKQEISFYGEEIDQSENVADSGEISRLKAEAGNLLAEMRAIGGEVENLLAKLRQEEAERLAKEESVLNFRKKLAKELLAMRGELGKVNEKPLSEIETYLSALKAKVAGFRREYDALEIPEDSGTMIEESGEIAGLFSGVKEVEKAAEERLAKIREIEDKRSIEETAARDLLKKISLRLDTLKEELGTLSARSSAGVETYLNILKEEIRMFIAESRVLENSANSPEVTRIARDIQTLILELRANQTEVERIFSESFKFESLRKGDEQAAKDIKIGLLRERETVKQDLRGLASRDSAEISAYLETFRETCNDFEGQYRALKNTTGSEEVVRLSGEIMSLLDETKTLDQEIRDALDGVREFEDCRRGEEDAAAELRQKIRLDVTEMTAESEGLVAEKPERIETYIQRLREKIGVGKAAVEAVGNTTGAETVLRTKKESEKFLVELESLEAKASDMLAAARELEGQRQMAIEAEELEKAQAYLGVCQSKYQAMAKSIEGVPEDELALEVKVQEIESLSREIERGVKQLSNAAGSALTEEAKGNALKFRDRLSEDVRALQERRGKLIRLREEEIAKELYDKVEEDLARVESILAEMAGWPSGNLDSYFRELHNRRVQYEERAGRLENTSGSTLVDFTRTNLSKIFKQLEVREGQIQQVLASARETETLRLEEESLARSLNKQVKKALEDSEFFAEEIQGKAADEKGDYLVRLKEALAKFRAMREALKNSTGSNEVDRLARESAASLQKFEGYIVKVEQDWASELEAEKQRASEEASAEALAAETKKERGKADSEKTLPLSGKSAAELRGMAEALEQRIQAFETRMAAIKNGSGSEKVRQKKEMIRADLAVLAERSKELKNFLIQAAEFEKKQAEELSAATDLRDRVQTDFEKMTLDYRDLGKKTGLEIEKFLTELEGQAAFYRTDVKGLKNESANAQIVQLQTDVEPLLAGMTSLAGKVKKILAEVRKKEEAEREEEAEAWDVFKRVKADLEKAENFLKDLRGKSLEEARKIPEEIRKQIEADDAAFQKMKSRAGRSEGVGKLSLEIEGLLGKLRSVEVRAKEVVKSIEETEAFKQKDEQAAVALFQKMEDDLADYESKVLQMKGEKPRAVRKFVKDLKLKKEEYDNASGKLQNRGDFSSVEFAREELRGKLGEWDRLTGSAEEVLKSADEQRKTKKKEDSSIQKLYDRVQQEVTTAEISVSNLTEMKPEDLHAMILGFRVRRKELFDTYWELANGKSMSEQSPLLQKTALMIQQMDDYERRFWQALQDKRSGAGPVPASDVETLREIESFKKNLEKKITGGNGGGDKIGSVIQDMESFLAKHEKKKELQALKIPMPETDSVQKPPLEKEVLPVETISGQEENKPVPQGAQSGKA